MPSPIMSENDPNGVWFKYPTSSVINSAKPWFTTHQDPKNDPHLSSNSLDSPSYINREGKGWWINTHQTEEDIYMNVFSTQKSEMDSNKIKDNRDKWRDLGFMHAGTDWKNLEMTAYVHGRFKSFVCCARGISSNVINNVENEVKAYKAYVFQHNPESVFAIEKMEYLYENADEITSDHRLGECEKINVEIPDSYWIGIKFIVYNLENHVRLELYLDNNGEQQGKNKHNWKLINQAIDEQQTIAWGSPQVSFRWPQNSAWVRFKNASVREIEVT